MSIFIVVGTGSMWLVKLFQIFKPTTGNVTSGSYNPTFLYHQIYFYLTTEYVL